MPYHIFQHSMMVRRVAVSVTGALIASGYRLDIRLVDVAAILHDIAKMPSIVSGGDHALMGRELLEAEGFPLVGDVIHQHVRLRDFEIDEALVVNYADKRVMHQQVVSLDQRFVDLMIRYGRDATRQERIRKLYADGRRAEKVLVDACGVEPEALNVLGLIPADYPLYGSGGVGREDGPVEIEGQDIYLEWINQD